jgi:hypothetical protein
MRQEPPNLAVEDPDQLAAPGHLKAQKLLGGEHERMLLIHRRYIVEPIEIAERLQIGLVLDQLLSAAVQKADMRIDALDDLAVQFQDQAQHAVRGRMLWSEIDGEAALWFVGHNRFSSASGRHGGGVMLHGSRFRPQRAHRLRQRVAQVSDLIRLDVMVENEWSTSRVPRD